MEHILKGFDVIVPEFPLLIVRFADLPASRWVLQPTLEPRELLFLRDMQKKLENSGVVLYQQKSFKVVYQIVAHEPFIGWGELVNPNYQHILVMRPVEDDHLSFGGYVWMHTPEEVMFQVLGGRLFESDDPTASGVHARDEMPDDAVLALHPAPEAQ